MYFILFFNKELSRPAYWSNYSKCRLLIHAVVNSKYFDLAIAGVIGSNVITMAMEYYMMPPVSGIADKYTILSIRLGLFLENKKNVIRNVDFM